MTEGRILIWQITNYEEGFACSACSWKFPNPNGLAEADHDSEEVNRSFSNHVCREETLLKRANWA